MPVPRHERFIEPVMRYLAEHPEGAPARQLYDAAAEALHLSDTDRAELLPSGKPVYKSRAGWANRRLKRVGLSVRLRHGQWQLTEQGRVFANSHPAPFSAEILEKLIAARKEPPLPSAAGGLESVTVSAEVPVSTTEPEPLKELIPAQLPPSRIFGLHVEAGLSAEVALDLVYQELLLRAIDATGASCGVLAVERDGGMVCRATTGFDPSDFDVLVNTPDGLPTACLRTRQPQLCVDTESDPHLDSAIACLLGIRSMLMVPVLNEVGPIGILEIFSTRPSAFSDRERSLLEILARDCIDLQLAGAAMERQPSAADTALSSDQPQAPEETPLHKLPAILESSSSPSNTHPPYQRRSLIFGALAILGIFLSLMIGVRAGWLVSASHPTPAPVQQALKSGLANPVAAPLAPTQPTTAHRSSTPSSVASQSAPTHSEDDLVVYDHGKVVFRMRGPLKKSGASPAVNASDSTKIMPPREVWLAPDEAERRIRKRIEPQYPVEAAAEWRAGNVVLEVLVGTNGSVDSIRTLSGDPLFAAAAADAVRQWRYEPYRRNKHLSSFLTDITLKFSVPSEN